MEIQQLEKAVRAVHGVEEVLEEDGHYWVPCRLVQSGTGSGLDIVRLDDKFKGKE
jgi:hypothetical protein